jgi:putative nucleotidyltransferase with HDIG domain
MAQAKQIANQLAVALTNSQLVDDLEKLAMGTIEALARTVDAKSKWTSGHSERVAEISATIGRNMGLAEKEIESLKRGGLLHDIGKIGISMAILDKPGRLDEKEYAAVCEHPAIGARILEPITAYQDILPMIAQHHEKFDGSGYPQGLRGEEIDLRARIMAVADVWDAVVSDRPYRQGWIHDRAKKLIVDGAGSHFDPKVVDVFLAVVAEA